MLQDYERLMSNLKDFNTEKVVERIIESNSESLVKILQVQLSEGVDNTGKVRNDKYALSTIKYKNKYGFGTGSITSHVTFYMTGGLYNSIFTEVGRGTYEFLSLMESVTSRSKTGSYSFEGNIFDKMVSRIGRDKFGLDEQNRLKFAETLLVPQFKKAFDEML